MLLLRTKQLRKFFKLDSEVFKTLALVCFLNLSLQGIFLVYDITSKRSFQHIMKWASDVDEVSHGD